MKKYKYIVVLGILIVGGIAYLTVQKTQKQVPLLPVNSPETVVIPQTEWVKVKLTSFNIEYPKNWELILPRAETDGATFLEGTYENKLYQLGIFYPIFTDYDPPGIPESLKIWVDKELSYISLERKINIKIFDIKVAGAEAKMVLNVPEGIYNDGQTRKYSDSLNHLVYVWKSVGQNPREIVLKQKEGHFNPDDAKVFLELFLSKIKS